jgi:fatty acid desaturase
MELLNVGFALLLTKMVVCILPGVGGIFLVVSSEDLKREMRNNLCNRLFGVSNAIPYPKFATTLMVTGLVLIALSLAASWFLILQDLIL